MSGHRPRLGLALGGGAARGWAHIGVIQYLKDEGIEVDVIGGTSIGAIVGGAETAGQLDTDRVQRTLARDDAPAAISQSAITGEDAMAASALHEFISIYGAVAGDLALLALAYGGVYLAGGIAARLADQLCSDIFLAACHSTVSYTHLTLPTKRIV